MNRRDIFMHFVQYQNNAPVVDSKFNQEVGKQQHNTQNHQGTWPRLVLNLLESLPKTLLWTCLCVVRQTTTNELTTMKKSTHLKWSRLSIEMKGRSTKGGRPIRVGTFLVENWNEQNNWPNLIDSEKWQCVNRHATINRPCHATSHACRRFYAL